MLINHLLCLGSYQPCGHLMCFICHEPGSSRCAFCPSTICEPIGVSRQIGTTELDDTCDRFRSVLASGDPDISAVLDDRRDSAAEASSV